MAQAADPTAEEFKHPDDVTPIRQLAQRDGAIALSALSLFAAADVWYVSTGLGFAALLSVLNGLVVGAGLGILAHEWGHFAGARLNGGIAPTTRVTSLFPMFVFDNDRSPAGAFRSMGVAGNLAHWSLVALLAIALPIETPGRLALVAGAFGFAVSASTTEFPIIRRAYAGASAIESFKGLSRAKLTRDRWIGAAAGLALFLLL